MKKCYLFIIVIVVFFQAIVPSSFFVEAKDSAKSQPEVCTWPSEMMSKYFNFQKEAINILWWSKVEERLMQLTASTWRVFTNKVLKVPASAIDLLATTVGVKSTVSNVVTSSVLLLLISASVLESNVDGFALLFKDRPIVRDYKQMLDIETQLFDVAYFRSKQIDLTRPIQWDILSWLNNLLEKYKKNWLLSQDVPLSTKSMAGAITNLIEMNTAMKDFISIGSESSKQELRKYLSDGAVADLEKDYKEVRKFSVCNSYFKSIKSALSNMMKGNTAKVKTAWQDIKQAMDRLNKALVGKWAWNFKNNRKSMCDNISAYEMAQLKAYWWPDWTCWSFVKVSWDMPDLSGISSAFLKAKKYFKEKKAQRKAKKEVKIKKTAAKQAAKEARKQWINVSNSEVLQLNVSAGEALQSANTTEEKKEIWRRMYWNAIAEAVKKQEFLSGNSTSILYNPEFSLELNNNFSKVFNEIMTQYQQSQENAVAADASSIFPMGKWIIDQINSTLDKKSSTQTKSKTIEDLNKDLEKIVDKQCAG